MKIAKARELVSVQLESLSLEQLQRHRVRLIDALRESTAEYGFAKAVADGFYKQIASESAKGFVPADLWLAKNLETRFNETDRRIN